MLRDLTSLVISQSQLLTILLFGPILTFSIFYSEAGRKVNKPWLAEQIWPTICFLQTKKLRVVFTFFIGYKQSKEKQCHGV